MSQKLFLISFVVSLLFCLVACDVSTEEGQMLKSIIVQSSKPKQLDQAVVYKGKYQSEKIFDNLLLEEYPILKIVESKEKFIPLTGTAEEILAKNKNERSRWVITRYGKRENGQRLAAELEVTSAELGDGASAWEYHIILTEDGQEIFRTIIKNPNMPYGDVAGLWVYKDSWYLEIVNLDGGEIIQDGESLNDKYNYEQAFGFQLMGGKPFFFYRQDGRVGISYDGQEKMLDYERVPHYGCCSSAVANPIHSKNLVSFFAEQDEDLYFVEIIVVK